MIGPFQRIVALECLSVPAALPWMRPTPLATDGGTGLALVGPPRAPLVTRSGHTLRHARPSGPNTSPTLPRQLPDTRWIHARYPRCRDECHQSFMACQPHLHPSTRLSPRHMRATIPTGPLAPAPALHLQNPMKDAMGTAQSSLPSSKTPTQFLSPHAPADTSFSDARSLSAFLPLPPFSGLKE
jgi:hypothetical protein